MSSAAWMPAIPPPTTRALGVIGTIAMFMVGGGILMLALGASWLVDGASRLALRLGVAPMIVGVTVVGGIWATTTTDASSLLLSRFGSGVDASTRPRLSTVPPSASLGTVTAMVIVPLVLPALSCALK